MTSTLWAPEHRGPLTVTDDFLVLDDPAEQQAFTRPAEPGETACESVLMVQGMYCAACADTVESALAPLPGVLEARVHAATRRRWPGRWTARSGRTAAWPRSRRPP